MEQEPSRTINFYSHTRGPYKSFSNFSPYPIIVNGVRWPTTEHYFQAMKFTSSPQYQEQIRTARTPAIAKQLGRSRRHTLRDDWESVKDDIMYQCVLEKFRTHVDIQAILLGTRNATLVEHTRNDRYWGDGGDGSGRNQLGQTLMRVRRYLRQ